MQSAPTHPALAQRGETSDRPSSPNRIVREAHERLSPSVDSSTKCRSRKKSSQAALDFRILNAQCLQCLEVIWVKNDFGISNAFSWLETWKSRHLVRIANERRRTPEVPRLIILLKNGGFQWPLLRLKHANKPNSPIGLTRAAASGAQLSLAPRIRHVKPRTRTHWCRRGWTMAHWQT